MDAQKQRHQYHIVMIPQSIPLHTPVIEVSDLRKSEEESGGSY